MNTTQNSAQPVIAVVGATGQQGGSVVDALLEAGANVRALVRDPGSDRSRALSTRAVELAQADLAAPDSLPAALAGVDAVFAMSTPGGAGGPAEERQQGIALADAAAASGVPRLVFSSVGGAERSTGIPHFESKRRIEEHVEQLGLEATIIRPVFFMDNLALMGASVEDGRVVVRLPLPDDVPLQMVGVRDIGKIAARILLGAAAPADALELAGDERTGTQIAQAIGTHLGLPARYEALPVEVLSADADLTAMFRWFAETDAYQADIDAVRALEPTLLDLPGWLTATGWTVPAAA